MRKLLQIILKTYLLTESDIAVSDKGEKDAWLAGTIMVMVSSDSHLSVIIKQDKWVLAMSRIVPVPQSKMDGMKIDFLVQP